jgi:hypothetical protein
VAGREKEGRSGLIKERRCVGVFVISKKGPGDKK